MSASRIRLFVKADLAPGAPVLLSAGQAHYLLHVMRLQAGDTVGVFNGRDGEWQASLDGTGKKNASLRIREQARPQAPEPDLWLVFAPLKKARMDMVVEKGTELGASVLWPVLTRNGDTTRINGERVRAQAAEAAEQCGRLTVPEVRDAVRLDALIRDWPRGRRLFVLDETGGGAPIADAFLAEREKPPSPHGLLVGPVGGFAPSELDALRKLDFATPIGLGPRILRAETAAVAALSCWQALLGDWRSPKRL